MKDAVIGFSGGTEIRVKIGGWVIKSGLISSSSPNGEVSDTQDGTLVGDETV